MIQKVILLKKTHSSWTHLFDTQESKTDENWYLTKKKKKKSFPYQLLLLFTDFALSELSAYFFSVFVTIIANYYRCVNALITFLKPFY